jgi:hypothetical protein
MNYIQGKTAEHIPEHPESGDDISGKIHLYCTGKI